jgi:hypothetical protein
MAARAWKINITKFAPYLFLLFGLSVLCGRSWGEDAHPPPDPQLLIPEILNGLETSITALEANMKASTRTINGLLSQVENMRNTIAVQQNQLDKESERYKSLTDSQLQKLSEYESTLISLKQSLTDITQQNQAKDLEILEWKNKDSKKLGIIFLLGGILALILAVVIANIIIKIKTGGGLSLLKKFL